MVPEIDLSEALGSTNASHLIKSTLSICWAKDR